MAQKKVCQICQMLRYQDLALKDAKYQYQVTRYLKLAQTARNRIVKASDFKNLYYCGDEHYALAADIDIKHKLLLNKLRYYGEISRRHIMRELEKAAFEHAEAVIIHGLDSVEANGTARELEKRKNSLSVRRRKNDHMVM